MHRLVNGHVMAVKKEIEEGRMTPTDSIGMEIIDLDNFMLNHKGGKTNIAELVNLKEHIDDVIAGISKTIEMFVRYHKDSPRYWGRLEKCPEYNEYAVSINLHNFMEGTESGPDIMGGEYFIPDNYELADMLLEEYKKSGGDVKGVNSDEHFRENANWKFKNKTKAQKLVNFIQKKYINPDFEKRMKLFNIKKVNFFDDKVEFEYND